MSDPPIPVAATPIVYSKWVAVSVALLAFALVILTIGIVESGAEERPNPLGEYPIQKVTDRIDGVSVPAIRVGDALHVTATKCSRADEPVPVRTERAWKLIDPLGTPVDGGPRSVVRRVPGCTTFTYENVVPQAVFDRTLHLIGEGRSYAVWQFGGIETPIVDGREGEPRVWQTENFRIYP